MISMEMLTKEYLKRLEIKIIEQLSIEKQLTIRRAMDIYYKSRLSSQICDCCYGIENMDYRYLAWDLIENESELFEET